MRVCHRGKPGPLTFRPNSFHSFFSAYKIGFNQSECSFSKIILHFFFSLFFFLQLTLSQSLKTSLIFLLILVSLTFYIPVLYFFPHCLCFRLSHVCSPVIQRSHGGWITLTKPPLTRSTLKGVRQMHPLNASSAQGRSDAKRKKLYGSANYRK